MLSTLAPSPALDGHGTPYIDIDEQRTDPAPHRYLHGGFEGSGTRFSLYLPPADLYRGRFFQHITPVAQSENLAQTATGEEDRITFASESGAAYLETNGGGHTFQQGDDADPTFGAYRANAACAEVAKHLLREAYGDHRVYSYSYGGSGGAFRTIGGAENTRGVWDGYVPYVPGTPMAMPNVFGVRLHAMRVLGDALDGVDDALAPGGSGDPYAHLTDEEAAAYTEATRLGFPPRSWFAHRTMGGHAFSVVFPALGFLDPTYFDDFWTLPGYEGADPSSSVHRDRVIHPCEVATTLTRADLPGAPEDRHAPREGGVDESFQQLGGAEVVAIRLSEPVPEPGLRGLAELVVESGAAGGARLVLASVVGDIALLDSGANPDALAALSPGDRIVVDNSNVLAAQTYHRHQVPPAGTYPAWDQFRDAAGEPLYPQRPMVLGPLLAAGAVGALPTGDFDGRMIMVACLMDREAFPWQADWYRQQVAAQLGDSTDSRYRLWYIDHATHGDDELQAEPERTVSYLGALHHAVRALAAWVEDGIEPEASTQYEVVDAQVIVPADARDRLGIQATVTLTVGGATRADVSPGTEMAVALTAAAPPGASRIVQVEWDLDGDGTFETVEAVDARTEIALTRTAIAPDASTRFIAARVTVQCEGDPSLRFGRLANLARARVVVAD